MAMKLKKYFIIVFVSDTQIIWLSGPVMAEKVTCVSITILNGYTGLPFICLFPICFISPFVA